MTRPENMTVDRQGPEAGVDAASPPAARAQPAEASPSAGTTGAVDPLGLPVIRKYLRDPMPIYNATGQIIGRIPKAELPVPGTPDAEVIGRSSAIKGAKGRLMAIMANDKIVRLNSVDLSIRIPGLNAVLGGALLGALVGGRKSGVVAGAAAGAGATDVPLLPWPPPKATWLGDISSQFKLAGTFADADSQLRDHLQTRGYETLHYFSVPGGYAVTTPAERFDDKGAPAKNRWVTGRVGGWDGFTEYLQRLVNGEQTQFRVFVIVVTSEDFGTAGFKITEADVERWNMFGRPGLSRRTAGMRLEPGTHVWLMVYEFRAAQAKGARMLVAVTPSSTFAIHRHALGFR